MEKIKGLVSVIITTYNRKNLVDECLKSVFMQDYPNFEIIVIDDNSSDGTAQFIKGNYPSVNLIKIKKKMGLPFNRNLGVLNSRGEYLLFMDDDAVLLSKSHMKRAIEILNVFDKIGQIGGSFENNYISRINKINGFDFDDDLIQIPSFLDKEYKECDYIQGNNCFMKKELFYELGGFDFNIKYPYDDAGFGLKLRKEGYRGIISKETAAFHKRSEMSRSESKFAQLNYHLRSVIKFQSLKKAIIYSLKAYFRLIISILAFIKQQFLGLRKETNETFPNLKSKLNRFCNLLIELFFFHLASILWNVLNLPEIIKSRELNFLELTEKTLNKQGSQA